MILRFQNPWFFSLILIWILIVFWKKRSSIKQVFVYSNISEFQQIPRSLAARIKPFVYGLISLGILLMITALARPQKGLEDFRVRTEGIAIAMCLDRSGSMQAMDFFIDKKRVNRLDVVKKVFKDFIIGNKEFRGRPDDLVSLIAFGGFVDSWCPLTLDHATLGEMLSMIECPRPPFDKYGRQIRNEIIQQESATAIGDALLCAVERLKDAKAKSKVIILLSDGVQNTGVITAEEAAKIAKDKGIKVYTIGIGSNEPVPFPFVGPSGEQVFRREILELDENALKGIAKDTGGLYFHVNDTDALKKVCEEIDKLERTVQEDRVYTRYIELYRWFLLPGLLALCTGLVLVYTRFRKIP
ncbi:MAG: VWA domain-containing protein [Planctomycetia bacterium]|nr:VWA domain-containing protein [Planctomycetia bacterium]